MKIYEIPFAMRQALERIEVDAETGEILNADELNAVTIDATEKIASTAKFIREQEAEMKAMKQAIDDIKARMDSKKHRIEYLKNLTLAAVTTTGTVETADIRVSLRKTESVEVSDIEDLPKDFVTQKVSFAADKMAIKRAIKSGQEIAGAQLVVGHSLQIK